MNFGLETRSNRHFGQYVTFVISRPQTVLVSTVLTVIALTIIVLTVVIFLVARIVAICLIIILKIIIVIIAVTPGPDTNKKVEKSHFGLTINPFLQSTKKINRALIENPRYKSKSIPTRLLKNVRSGPLSGHMLGSELDSYINETLSPFS